MSRSQTDAVYGPGPLSLEKFGDLAPLRKAFERGSFTPQAVAQTMGVRVPGEGLNLPVLLHKTEGPGEFNTLFRLFIIGLSVTEDSARRALEPMPLPALIEGGLLRLSREGVRSLSRLAPFEHLYCLADFTPRERPGPEKRNRVLGVNPSSVCLANLTVRRHGESVFDMGTGSGIQSLLAAEHASSVIGSDLNLRALNFAAFNARLNGATKVEWRAGRFFEPVHDQEFDLVVSNPPFVISPGASLQYRDGGLPGDGVSEQTVKGAAAHLKEGGYASLLLNWHHQKEEDWHERPWSWAAENGCDCWLVRYGDEDPLAYAAVWLQEVHHRNPRRYAELLNHWLKYYEELGIRRLAHGQMTLRRRRAQENWFRCDTLLQIHGVCPCGDHIQRVFAAEDFLDALMSPEELLEQRHALAPDLVLDQRLVPKELGWAVEAINVRFVRGLPFVGNVDPIMLRLLNLCDGSRRLKELIPMIGVTEDQEAKTLVQRCLELARTLVRWGMLVPKSSGQDSAARPD